MALSESDLAAFHAIQLPRMAGSPKKKGRSGTLTSLISEGGALGGGAAGAAIGTGILPGVGTLIGGALGAGLGAFGGRVAENKVRDDRFGFGDAAKEGAISAAFGASPIKLGKAAFAAKKGGIGLAEALKAGVPKLEAAAASKALPGRTSLPGKMDEMANKLLTGQYGTIRSPIARATNPEKTFSKLYGLGITKPSDVERISGAVTGTDGLLNRAVVKAAGESHRVDVSDLRQVLKDAMENNGVVGNKEKELTTMFDAQMKKLLGGPKGSLDSTAHPSDVLDVMKSFEKRIAQKTGKGSNYRLATDETTNQANALALVKDELQGRLESGANVKSVLTPELRNKLVSLHPNNDAWQKYVDNNVMKSKDLKSLRSAQSPFVNAKKIIEDADLNSMTFGGRVGNNANASLREAFMNAVVSPLKNPARRATASTLKTASNLTQGVPVLPNVPSLPQGIKIGAKSQLGEGLASALLAGQSSNTLMPSDASLRSMEQNPQMSQANNTDAMNSQLNPNISQATTMAAMNSNISDGLYPNSQDMSSTSPFDISNVESNLQKLVAGGATDKDIQNYLSIVSTISDLKAAQAKNNGNSLSSTTATQVASSANAANTLDQLQGLFGSAGGGSGKIGGSIKNALSRAGLDGDAQTYNDLSASSVSQLARALNGGGQVSDADAQVVVQALPKITDSPAVAARKFAAIRARLDAARQNTLLYGGGNGSSLESALGP